MHIRADLPTLFVSSQAVDVEIPFLITNLRSVSAICANKFAVKKPHSKFRITKKKKKLIINKSDERNQKQNKKHVFNKYMAVSMEKSSVRATAE